MMLCGIKVAGVKAHLGMNVNALKHTIVVIDVSG